MLRSLLVREQIYGLVADFGWVSDGCPLGQYQKNTVRSWVSYHGPRSRRFRQAEWPSRKRMLPPAGCLPFMCPECGRSVPIPMVVFQLCQLIVLALVVMEGVGSTTNSVFDTVLVTT